jgi:hypothetical protein
MQNQLTSVLSVFYLLWSVVSFGFICIIVLISAIYFYIRFVYQLPSFSRGSGVGTVVAQAWKGCVGAQDLNYSRRSGSSTKLDAGRTMGAVQRSWWAACHWRLRCWATHTVLAGDHQVPWSTRPLCLPHGRTEVPELLWEDEGLQTNLWCCPQWMQW